MPSEFYKRIYAVVMRIPCGKVATYGQIAALAGRPGAARQVGYALHALPAGHHLPWHRVMNAQGRISLPDPHAAERQKSLLAAEGVVAGTSGGYNLNLYRWDDQSS